MTDKESRVDVGIRPASFKYFTVRTHRL